MMSSAELERKLTGILKRYGRECRLQLLIVVSPDTLEGLRYEHEKNLIEIERRYGGRLNIRKDPSFHSEQFKIINMRTGEELASVGG